MDTAVASDRAEIRSAIEAMSQQFATLMGEIGDRGWKTRSGIPAYTCGQLAWHLASGTAFLAGEIEKAKDGKALNPPAFVRPILYKLSEWRTRVASRKATPTSVRADFDVAARKLLAVLRFTPENSKKIVEHAAKLKAGEKVSIPSESWFPAELVSQGDLSGDDNITATAYPADEFFQAPYSEGKLSRVENSDFFVLEMTAK